MTESSATSAERISTGSLLEKLRDEQSTGPTLNAAEQRVLYMLLIYADGRVTKDEDAAIRLDRQFRDAAVFEGEMGRVQGFLFNLLGLQ